MDVFDVLDLAQDRSVELVALVDPADHHRPTPCDGWSVSMLLGRMLASARMHTALARGDAVPTDIDSGEPPRSYGPVEPPGVYAEACGECHGAFVNLGPTGQMLDRHGDAVQRTSGAMARVVDVIVDTWDLAAALDVPPVIDPHHAAMAFDFALNHLAVSTVPTGGSKTDAPTFESLAGFPLHQLLRLTGRNPNWTPPTE